MHKYIKVIILHYNIGIIILYVYDVRCCRCKCCYLLALHSYIISGNLVESLGGAIIIQCKASDPAPPFYTQLNILHSIFGWVGVY